MPRIALAPGIDHHPGYLDPQAQVHLLRAIEAVIAAAPLFTPRMLRTGKPFSVRMTNCGALGWVSDTAGYRYQPTHPETGDPWPPMPAPVLEAWRELAGYPHPPEACLINLYRGSARMGLHQDRDEEDLDAPVVSLSLGDTGVFRWGGTSRGGPTRSVRLASGDALVFGGPARLVHHGIDRILGGSSRLLEGSFLASSPGEGARVNLTLRRVTRPA